MNTVMTVVACSLAQLLLLTAAWAAFAAVDPIGAMACLEGYEDPGTLTGRMLAWPKGVVRMLRFFPPVAIVDLGGYILMLALLGPGVAAAAFVLNHIVTQLMVRE
jgi:hypothetical protein